MKEIMTCEICGCSFVDVESEEGYILWRIIGTNKFEDGDGNLVIFSQKDIKDYLVKVG